MDPDFRGLPGPTLWPCCVIADKDVFAVHVLERVLLVRLGSSATINVWLRALGSSHGTAFDERGEHLDHFR